MLISQSAVQSLLRQAGQKLLQAKLSPRAWRQQGYLNATEGMGFTVVPFGQGCEDMSPPTKEFCKFLMEGRIIRGGNPVMRWMAGNVVVDTDPAGNIKPTSAGITRRRVYSREKPCFRMEIQFLFP